MTRPVVFFQSEAGHEACRGHQGTTGDAIKDQKFAFAVALASTAKPVFAANVQLGKHSGAFFCIFVTMYMLLFGELHAQDMDVYVCMLGTYGNAVLICVVPIGNRRKEKNVTQQHVEVT